MARVKGWTNEPQTKSLDFLLQTAISCLESAIDKIDDSCSDKSRAIAFSVEQLKLLSTNKHARHYSPELSIFAYIIHATSAAAYNVLIEQNVFCLPSVRTLKKITRRLNVTEGLDNSAYLSLRVGQLNELQRTVVLIIDEIYIAKRLEYSGGQIVGLTNDGTVASTLLCFAVKSLACKYMDLVAIYPMAKLTADKLNACYNEVSSLMKKVSINVVALSVDNASTNRKFYTDFLCGGELKTHIIDSTTGQPLYLIIDPVHTLKNIYNNFQARKFFDCPSMPGDLPDGCKADFGHIAELHHHEETMSLKKAHMLRPAVLQPKSIEKTSVKLAVAVFCESTRDALRYYAANEGKVHWTGTADFINLVTKLWNVLNVKTCCKGKFKRNETMDPVRDNLDWQLGFLIDFAVFVAKWEASKKPGLTRETFIALRQTCLAVAECAEYLLTQRGFEVVLIGHLQSDPIESRFGWLRQMSGANYFISMKQVLDSDRKIRALSLLKFSHISLEEIDETILKSSTADSGCSSQRDDTTADTMVESLNYDHQPSVSDSNIVYYVSGYISRSVCRITRCVHCKEALVGTDDMQHVTLDDSLPQNARMFFDSVNRGGLKTPTEFVFMLTIHCWTVFEEIRSQPELMNKLFSADSHISLFFKIMDRATCHQSVADYGLNNYMCTQGHDLTKLVVHRFFNCVAKNLVKALTSAANPHSEPRTKRRKIDKLCSKT